MSFFKTHYKTVILRAWDFLDLSCSCMSNQLYLQAPKQSRHPERSASQIYCITRALWRGVEGPQDAYLAYEVRGFSTTMPEYRIGISCPRYEGKTVADPPDAASVVKSSERHG